MTITTDNKFAQIPEWVIDSEISDGALRLYAVLLRYADYRSGEAFPARKTLAVRLRKTDRSIDTYTKELVEIGALVVTKRFLDADRKRPTSNKYTVITANPNYVAPPSEETFAPPGEVDFSLTIPSINDTHLNAPASRRKPRRALPTDWSPNTHHQQTAQKRNLDLTREAQAFRNHAESVDRRLADWDKGFDNWLLKAHPANRQPPWKVDNSLNPFDRSNYG